MDGPVLRQRHPSNTSLRSTSRAHGKHTNNSGYRPGPHRRPLRSVNENAALLRCPGPLESMLKTTTETGDIGIYSIKSRSSSTAMYLQPLRSRSNFGDPCRLPLPLSYAEGYDENYFYDDHHRRLRSNRDTTSEILSLYGSESQQFMPTSVSPSLDDGLRSYSLTTTRSSSRHAHSHKSPGMLQTQSSSGGLQRPRSPFPYPTRLKRPGVRPASPALAENGHIDYSRMVELDRVSQRTVHGSYKSTYAHGSRRGPPLSLRAEANRSTISLPSRTSPSSYYYCPPHHRVRTPSSLASWTQRHSDRHHDHDRHQRGSASGDQSTRSASLTSIVEMYDRPVPANAHTHVQPLHSPSSFYYDYTEEFENQFPIGVEVEIPLCPIPQRVGRISQPMVLRNDSPMGLDPADNVNMRLASASQHPKLDKGAANTIAGTVEPGTSNPSNDEIAHQTRQNERPAPPISTPESHGSSSCGSPKRSGDAARQASWHFAGALEADGNATDNMPSSLSKLRCTLDPAISDFASILSSFDRFGKSPSPKGEAGAATASEVSPKNIRFVDSNDPDSRDSIDGCPSPPASDNAIQEQRAYRKGHRRNNAAPRISMPEIEVDEVSQGSKAELIILEPEPISPLRQRRIGESIPWLMKALPPLPLEIGSPPDQVAEAVNSPEPCSEVLPPNQEAAIDYGKCGLESKPLPCPVEEPRISRISPPKFKIRAKSSLSAVGDGTPKILVTAEEPSVHEGPDPKASTAAKPKLRLKISRSQLGQKWVGQGMSRLPNNRLKQCNSLAELGLYTRNEEADGKRKLDTPITEHDSITHIDGGPKEEEEESGRSGPSPQHSDQFNISYPRLPERIDSLPQFCEPAKKREVRRSERVSGRLSEGLSEEPSIDYHDGRGEQRGLRNKLSMFRLRLIGTPSGVSSNRNSAVLAAKQEEACLAATKHEGATLQSVASVEMRSNDDAGTSSIMDGSRRAQPRRGQSKARIKRWARDAKKAVRSYVKRSLDR